MKKSLIIVTIVLVILNVLAIGYLFVGLEKKEEDIVADKIEVEQQTIVDDSAIEEEEADNSKLIEELKKEKESIDASIDYTTKRFVESYDAYYGISSAYQGKIMFDSNLINMPFVSCSDNNQYLRTNWLTGGYDELGSIFMDSDCNLDSQNIIIYGHYVYPSYYVTDGAGNRLDTRRLMFTPLSTLTDYNNCINNRNVYLVFQNSYRLYEIEAVFYIYLTGDDTNGYYISDEYLYYNLSSYSDEYFEQYKSHIQGCQFFDLGSNYSNSDRLLTLQTCVEGNNLAREIVLCKQIGSGAIDRETYNIYSTKLKEFETKVIESGLTMEDIVN